LRLPPQAHHLGCVSNSTAPGGKTIQGCALDVHWCAMGTSPVGCSSVPGCTITMAWLRGSAHTRVLHAAHMRPVLVRPSGRAAKYVAGSPCRSSSEARRTHIESAKALPVRRWQSRQ
jgi:hypothetical protein